jgi:hypothetical protein
LIRKEHVRCRYGVFKVRASSKRPPFTRPRPSRGSVPQSSTACGWPSRGPTRETRSTLF